MITYLATYFIFPFFPSPFTALFIWSQVWNFISLLFQGWSFWALSIQTCFQAEGFSIKKSWPCEDFRVFRLFGFARGETTLMPLWKFLPTSVTQKSSLGWLLHLLFILNFILIFEFFWKNIHKLSFPLSLLWKNWL